jgi:hypothetical protein
MSRLSRVCQFILLCSLFSFAFGCGPQNSGSPTKISIHFPSAKSSTNPNASADSYDFSKACFAVNILGSDLTQAASGKCDVPSGVFAGFVAPGGDLTLTVPRGTARTLEVFSFMRDSSSTACPTLPNFGTLQRSRLTRVGSVASFDTKESEVTLDVTISAPASGVSVVTQYNLPAICNPPASVPPLSRGTARLTLAHARTSGGSFIISGSVNGLSNQVQLSGGNFKIELTRKTD